MTDKAALCAENLSVGYRKEKTILENISFSANQGELIGIIGPNGAGKSTLLKTLRGLLEPLAGKVFIAGRESAKISGREFALRAGFLQQNLEVSFGYTVKDIVMTGRYPYLPWWANEKEEDEKIVDACMRYTGVEQLAQRPLHMISGGQRQRALLAKVLAQQTPILLLDEPTAGLDIFYIEEIFRLCKELSKAGKTVIMVVHELSVAAKFCSRLLLAGKGRIVADGAPKEVMTSDNLTEAYEVPMGVAENPLTGTLEVFTEPSFSDEKRRELLPFIINNSPIERSEYSAK